MDKPSGKNWGRPRACLVDGSDCGHPECPPVIPELNCDRCRKPIVGVGRGHDQIEFTNLHVAAGNQTAAFLANGDEEWKWDPESEYDFCAECETAWHAAFEAFMGAGRKGSMRDKEQMQAQHRVIEEQGQVIKAAIERIWSAVNPTQAEIEQCMEVYADDYGWKTAQELLDKDSLTGMWQIAEDTINFRDEQEEEEQTDASQGTGS